MAHLHKYLDDLIQKYSDNDYIMGRLDIYIKELLPSALLQSQVNYDQREKRKKILQRNREEFIERFMSKNSFFYCVTSRLFLNYDGIHFIGYSEDDIQHKILSTITEEGCLTVWKYKINNDIIRRIKMRTPLNAIPESYTIQHTINMLVPNLFSCRYKAKHFLTLIGDNILGKTSTNIVYIISVRAKDIIQEIGHLCTTHFGQTNIVSNIKYKFYGHDYTNCRLLDVNSEYVSKNKNLISDISKYIIDLLSVSAHYSTRYGSADKYLEFCSDNGLRNYVGYLSSRTSSTIVKDFVTSSIEVCQGSTIDQKNMIFIWKKYLKERKLPNVLFHEQLFNELKNLYDYDAKNDCFNNITSTSLPIVSAFIHFWENTITIENDEELEIDEVYMLFKRWSKKQYTAFSELLSLELIRHYFPDVEIESDKYILSVKSKTWMKHDDVVNSIELYKLHVMETKIIPTLCDAYEYYILHCRRSVPAKYTASKRYFEKVAIEELGNTLDIDGIISSGFNNG